MLQEMDEGTIEGVMDGWIVQVTDQSNGKKRKMLQEMNQWKE
jgi:hypothetical protein